MIDFSNLFRCPICHTGYGSFREVLECIQWHPTFLIRRDDEAEKNDDGGDVR